MAGQVFYKRKDDGLLIPINPGPRGEKGDKGDKGDTGAPGVDGQDGADGQDFTPTDADNRYVNVTGDTMTGDLTIEKGFVQIKLLDRDGVQRGRMFVQDLSDVVEFGTTDDAGTPIVRFIAYGPANSAIPNVARIIAPNGVRIDPPTDIEQVPRLARAPNPTTGDLGLPGYAGSDTGWRDVSADLESGWQTDFAMRRMGNLVSVACGGNWTEGSDSLFYTWPAGFSPEFVARIPIIASTNALAAHLLNGPTNMRFIGTVINQSIEFQFATALAWPSSLPGTEITPPASWT